MTARCDTDLSPGGVTLPVSLPPALTVKLFFDDTTVAHHFRTRKDLLQRL